MINSGRAGNTRRAGFPLRAATAFRKRVLAAVIAGAAITGSISSVASAGEAAIPQFANVAAAAVVSSNIAGNAAPTASSQNSQSGQKASKAVDGIAAGYPGDSTKEWATQGGRAGSWIQLSWPTAVHINRVVLYDRPNSADQVTGGRLIFDDGTFVTVPALNNAGAAQTVSFASRLTRSVRFRMTSVSTSTVNIGLSEFEAWTSPTGPTTQPATTAATTSTATASRVTTAPVTPVTPTQPGSSTPPQSSPATPTPSSAPATVISPTLPVSTAPATAAPTTPADAGGAMPVGDLPGWKQVFADDFSTDVTLGSFPGASYSSRWFPYHPGCCDTSGFGTYDASKVVSVSGGVMDAYLHTEGGKHYVNAMVAKAPATGWGQLYGRYAIRMRADAIPGYKVVPLLWPDSDVWDQGEIDFPEVNVLSVGEKTKANVYLAGSWQNFQSMVDIVGGWHTYVTEWSPGLLTFYIDGVQVWTTSRDVPTVPMHYVLQFESAIGVGAPSNTAAGHVQVDWTTLYSRTA